MKKKVLFITNIPNPYRIDFFNRLAEYFDLTVIFEAKGAEDQGIHFNWNEAMISNFCAVFLSEGTIRERKFDTRILKHLKKPYDEIIVTNYAYFTEMLAIVYLKIKRIAYSMEIDGGRIKKESGWRKALKRFLVRGAKRYFSSSEENDRFLHYYGAKAERIVRYPFSSVKADDVLSDITSSEQKQMIKDSLQIPEERVILGVGQFIHRKGWDVLLKACVRFDGEKTGVYIIGGQAPEEYQAIIKENNLQNIHLLSFLPSEVLKKYYAAADVFVLPTREDIWGLVINEAMACGLPVVTTNECIAGRELVREGENGFLVPAEDEEGLAEKIVYVLTDDVRRLTMARSSLRIARKYTIEEMVKAHVEVLRQ